MRTFIFRLFSSVVAGVLARNKGRSGFGFFLFSIALSPMIGTLAALATKSTREIERDKLRVRGIYRKTS